MTLSNTLESHSQDYDSLVNLPLATGRQYGRAEMVGHIDVQMECKTLLEINMIIDSDASMQEWEAHYRKQTTGEHGHNGRQHSTSTA